MRSGLVQTGAWAAATGVAVLLSWLGVSSVLSDSAFAPPLPLPVPASAPPALPAPVAASASPSPSAQSGATDVSATQHPSATASAAPSHRPPTPAATSTDSAAATPGTVQSYLVPGGRVALDMHPDSADLVSATPDTGWQMQVWHGDQWLRIDFTLGSSTNSVFVTWNGHPPDVQTVVR
ncbi:hypothetical protein P3T36_003102 [Kitasatospora sp. MAP12-15]|uniref:hypothetical protein n=1 Tax=unclassified Kitasatospora TaxID=2633591 RepID=UPI00247369BD|nr:hypothetical protein [Kitasatospora sp. MAP12-44]MDH6110733.1 hypothetical protein [Kitasatospora sp. MAP12-44]